MSEARSAAYRSQFASGNTSNDTEKKQLATETPPNVSLGIVQSISHIYRTVLLVFGRILIMSEW